MNASDKPEPEITISDKQIINIFTLFVIGSVIFVILNYLPKNPETNFYVNLYLILQFIGGICYLLVLLVLLVYYFIKGRVKLINHLKKHGKSYAFWGFVLVCIIIIIIIYIKISFWSAVITSGIFVIGLIATLFSNFFVGYFKEKILNRNKKVEIQDKKN